MSTNGRTPADATKVVEAAKRQARIRPAKILVPAMLALGIILVLRYLEQSTAAS